MRLIITLLCAIFVGAVYVQSVETVQSMVSSIAYVAKPTVVAHHTMSLENRNSTAWVNRVFKDNILLTLGYMSGNVQNASTIDWDSLHKDFLFEIKLQPGEVFAYHDAVLPAYQTRKIITTNAHFSLAEGFLSDGLVGDGVCHLASLMNWAARDAGLEVETPTNHDFARIPDVPAEYGVSIFSMPGNDAGSAMQNLYIVNNKQKAVTFVFHYTNGSVSVTVLEETK